MGKYLIFFALILSLTQPKFSLADQASDSLLSLSLEELSNVTVTSLSKKEEGKFGAAASVYVVSKEEIRRSGATNIPEALRMVPGLNVARIDMNNYQISMSTNNDYFTEKMLVLIDGRALQSSTFSQVWWQASIYPLEDVERIEVIRGPGAAIWGANAMNGVINVITKTAKQTEGTIVSAGGGSNERDFTTVRVGGGDDSPWRGYFMTRDSGGARIVRSERSPNPRDGGPEDNYSRTYQGGFRKDWDSEDNKITLHGDIYQVKAMSEGASFTEPGVGTPHYVYDDTFSGDNLMWRLEHAIDKDLSTSVQVYYDNQHVNRIFFDDNESTFDGELQANLDISKSNKISVGLNGRYTDVKFGSTTAMQMANTSNYEAGAFIQDEIRFSDDKGKIVLGVKEEKNSWSDWQLQPSVRAAWNADEWMAWAGFSKSSRLPNNANNGLNWVIDSTCLNLPGNPCAGPMLGIISSKGLAKAEDLYVYEGGMRMKPADWIEYDFSAFYNQYHNLLSLVESNSQYWVTSPQPAHYVYDIYYANVYDGTSYGFDLSTNMRPTLWLRIFGGYSYSRIGIQRQAGWPDNRNHDYSVYLGGSTPLYTIKGGTYIDLPYGFELNLMGYYMDSLPALYVQSYFRLDAQLVYRPTKKTEISITGRNLTQYRHEEWYSPAYVDNAWFTQDYFIKATYKF